MAKKSLKLKNGLTEAEIERLALMSEEAGEVQKCIGKILRHGYDKRNPLKKDGKTNREKLTDEIGDFVNAKNLMVACGDVDAAVIERRVAFKATSCKAWLHHAHNIKSFTAE